MNRKKRRTMMALSAIALSMLGSCSFGKRTTTVESSDKPAAFTITLNPGVGSYEKGDTEVVVDYGGRYQIYRPVNNDYVFEGWFLDDGTEVLLTGRWTYTRESATVTARWSRTNLVTVDFTKNTDDDSFPKGMLVTVFNQCSDREVFEDTQYVSSHVYPCYSEALWGCLYVGQRTTTISTDVTPYVKLPFIEGFSFNRCIVNAYINGPHTTGVELGIGVNSGGDYQSISYSGPTYTPYRYSFGYRQNWLEISSTDAMGYIHIGSIEMWTT